METAELAGGSAARRGLMSEIVDAVPVTLQAPEDELYRLMPKLWRPLYGASGLRGV